VMKRIALSQPKGVPPSRNAVRFSAGQGAKTGWSWRSSETEEKRRLGVISCAPLVSDQDRTVYCVRRYSVAGSTELVWIGPVLACRTASGHGAIMRLHAGFHPPKARFRRPMVVGDWILGCRWGSSDRWRDQFVDVGMMPRVRADELVFSRKTLPKFAPTRTSRSARGSRLWAHPAT